MNKSLYNSHKPFINRLKQTNMNIKNWMMKKTPKIMNTRATLAKCLVLHKVLLCKNKKSQKIHSKHKPLNENNQSITMD